MKTFKKWRRLGFFAFALLLIAGCTEEGSTRVDYGLDYWCSTETQKVRADFILQCIANANPKSDEEPEDWITKCRDMAETTYCEERAFEITMFYNGGYWRKAKKKLVHEDQNNG